MILERDKAKKAKMNMSTIPVKDAKNPQTTSNKRTFSPKKLTLTITSNQPDLVQSQVRKNTFLQHCKIKARPTFDIAEPPNFELCSSALLCRTIFKQFC